MMKNSYITDLDHTFLRSDLSISAFTKGIWNSYASHSIMSVATARTFKKTEQFMQGIEVNAPMILLDGALVATMDKKIIDTKFIPKFVADEIIDEGGKMGIYPFVLSLGEGELHEDFLYSDILNPHQKTVLARYASDDNLQVRHNIRGEEKNFKIVYMGEEELLRDLDARLRELFGDAFAYILAPEAYVGCYFLTVLHKDADKAHGIKSVSEYSGFDLEKLTVFGDNFNDVGMFELARHSLAVSNAQDGVKKLASMVSEFSNDDDAVARYLEKLQYAK